MSGIHCDKYEPKLLIRRGVNKILSNIFKTRLFVLVAPIGYGKTIAVKNYLSETSYKTVWFTVDFVDYDASVLWKRFCNNIREINEELANNMYEKGYPSNENVIQELLKLFEEYIVIKTVIVLDEWELVHDKVINRFIERVILKNISGLHIVIIGRQLPKIDILEYEVRNKCFIIRKEDLEFTLQEITQFFLINGVNLNQYEVEKINDRTSGWPAAVGFSLEQYLKNNDLNQVVKATELIKNTINRNFNIYYKEILAKLALLECFTLDEAYYVVQDKTVYDIIKELKESNFFIEYDNCSYKYRFDKIFKEVLFYELKSSHIDKKNLYNRIASLYEKDGKLLNAIKFYCESKNYDKVLNIVEKTMMYTLMNDVDKIISVFKESNEEIRLRYPISYILIIYLNLIYGKFDEGVRLLEKIKCFYKNKSIHDKIWLEILFIDSLIRDDYSLSRNNKEILGGEEFVIFKAPILNTVMFNNLMLFSCKSDKININYHDFEKKIWIYICKNCGQVAGLEELIKAEQNFIKGNILEAERYAYKSMYESEEAGEIVVNICSNIFIIRMDILNAKSDKAICRLKKLEDKCNRYKEYMRIPNLKLVLSYIHSIMLNSNDVSKVIEDINLSEYNYSISSMKTAYIVKAFTKLSNKNYLELSVLAKVMRNKLEKNILTQVYSFIFESISEFNLNNLEYSIKCMEEAIKLAKRHEIVMIFIELSSHILCILKKLKRTAFVADLIERCEKIPNIHKVTNTKRIDFNLTQREIEVMELIYNGSKQADIGKILNVSLNTVRYHTKNIYHKFNVSNKVEALRKYVKIYK